MNFFKSIWSWLSVSRNQKTLGWLGSGLVVLIGGGWSLYLHFSTKPSGFPMITASDGSVSIVGSGNNVTVGITLEQYEAGLKRKEEEFRAELSQLRREKASDKEKIALVEKQLAEVQARLKNPESALGEYKNKLEKASQALEDLKQEIPVEVLDQAKRKLHNGQTGDAERLFEKVRLQGKEKAAEAALQLAALALNRIDYSAAYRYSKEAATLQLNNPLYLGWAGYIANMLGLFNEAELLYKRSLAILEKALGPNNPNVATELNNLAELYRAQGQYAQAELLYKRSLAIDEKVYGPSHPDVATGLSNLAALYHAQGLYAQAEPLNKRALAIREKALGPDHPDVATSMNNLAALYRDQGQYEKAEPLFKRALAIDEKAYGPNHPDVATYLENMAVLYKKTRREKEAAELEKRAAAIRAIKR